MLVLLPEFEQEQVRLPLQYVRGIKPHAGLELTPELVERIKAVESGREELPELVVDQDNKLVVLEPYRVQSINDFMLYIMGAFSTAKLKKVTLSSTDRVTNVSELNRLQRLTDDAFRQVLEAAELDEPEGDDLGEDLYDDENDLDE